MSTPRRLLMAVLICSSWLPRSGAAQEASIQGIVSDQANGQPVADAIINLQRDSLVARTAVSDRNGFYQIGGIEPGEFTLRIQELSYLPHEQTLSFVAGQHLTVSVRLRPNPLTLDEVLIAPVEGGAVLRDFGRQRVTVSDLGLVPTPSVSGDLASYLQTLPGVVTTGDRGGQLFIRGGTPAENLVLVDGLTIYQPFHILGFFSVFPESLVANADFYAGGFGSRYVGRTSSVLDVQMREGSRTDIEATGSVGPFLVEAVAEGPLDSGRASWIASVRRSLIEETSPTLLGETQPLTFESQFLKVSAVDDATGSRCSGLAMRTSDRGRLDADLESSRVGWENLLFGGRCVMLFDTTLRLLDVTFGYSAGSNDAISRGASRLKSEVSRLQHEAHVTSLLGTTPLYAGYSIYREYVDYDLTELYGIQRSDAGIFGMSTYGEVELSVGDHLSVRPGTVVTLFPRAGFEPRVRARFSPLGRDSEEVTAALGLYRQDLTGLSDLRDVSSVFVAWSDAEGGVPLESIHATLGWQQELSGGFQWSLEGYYKRLRNVPVPVWSAVAVYNTQLSHADGHVRGADVRLEYRRNRVYGFLGYGYSSTEYEATQDNFGTWFGDPVQRYHPPHDRRHQVNAMFSANVGAFNAGLRWQLGSGLPYTRPLGFDQALDFRRSIQSVERQFGIPRLVLDRPYNARLPSVHRLDLWVGRPFELPFGELEVQAGAMNVYDRVNMFYFDLYTNRRVDQLPIAPYLSVGLRSR